MNISGRTKEDAGEGGGMLKLPKMISEGKETQFRISPNSLKKVKQGFPREWYKSKIDAQRD